MEWFVFGFIAFIVVDIIGEASSYARYRKDKASVLRDIDSLSGWLVDLQQRIYALETVNKKPVARKVAVNKGATK